MTFLTNQPPVVSQADRLLRFAVQGMLSAARAELFNFHAARVIAPIFFGGVVALFAIYTG